MAYFLENLRNTFDFFLRNRITFSRKNYSEKPENISNLLSSAEVKELYEALKEKYDTFPLKTATGRNFSLNLCFLELFDKYLTPPKGRDISVLDIGSKNWAYVKSEYAFFKTFAKNLVLKGIELDAYRMYSNFYTRYEVAKFYTKDLPETEYIAGDFMEHEGKYDYIIWILPFITEYPLVKWGLPLKYLKPEEMLSHAYDLLNKGGELLIVNQGEEEYKIQQGLNKSLGLDAEYFGEITSAINIFKNKRYCSKITKG